MSKLNLGARPGRLVSVVDAHWKLDVLPSEDILVPLDEMPDPDSDNGAPITGKAQETLRELEKKWTDLGLKQIIDNTRPKV